MNNKVWRIRHKKTGEYLSLGYKRKSSWLVKPLRAIKENLRIDITDIENDYEFVIFELRESAVESIKL